MTIDFVVTIDFIKYRGCCVVGVESVVIGLGNELYALPVKYVQSIEKPLSVTMLPNVAGHVLGYVDYRDQICTLMDMGSILGMEKIEDGDSVRDVFVVLEDGEVLGLRVDEVIEVVELNESEETGTNGYHLNFLDEYLSVSRHNDSFVLVVDVEEMLASILNVDTSLADSDHVFGVTKEDDVGDGSIVVDKINFR